MTKTKKTQTKPAQKTPAPKTSSKPKDPPPEQGAVQAEAPAVEVPAAPQSTQPVQTSVQTKSTGKWVVTAVIGCGVALVLCGVIAFSVWWFKYRDPGSDIDSTVSERTILDLSTGSVNEEASKQIGIDGGKVTVTDNSSAIKGATIQLGKNDLDEKEEITIGYREITASSISDEFGLLSDVIVLSRENEDELFNKPVAVTVPYNKSDVKYGDFIGVYEIVDDAGTIEEASVINIDEENGKITFMVTHFSDFIVLEYLAELVAMLEANTDSGFRPGYDGFHITNWGAYSTDGGNCMGMSMMSKYYYANQKVNHGDFKAKFIEGDAADETDDKVAQELAGRSQLSMGARWSNLAADLTRFGNDAYFDQKEHGEALLMDLAVTKQPQLITLYTVYTVTKPDGTVEHKWAEGGHMVMVYKFDLEGFHVYDPNYPGDASRRLAFDGTKFGTYGSQQNAGTGVRGYNEIAHIGTNLTTENATLAALFQMALAGFPDDKYPEIEFSSPEDGETVSDKKTMVTGTVTGGDYETEAGEKFAHWYFPNENGGQTYLKSAIEDNGSFTVELPLVPGENKIHMLAAGAKPHDEWAGYATISLTSQMKPADMVVTMSWARGQSDIDLHMWDPNDEHVYFSHMTAVTGAELDVDNTSGYGPEHITISSAEGDDMPYGDYLIKVHYYADHDSDYESVQSVPWTVNVRWVSMIIPETEEKIWEDRTFTGALTSEKQYQVVYTVKYTAPEDVEIEVEEAPDYDFSSIGP